MNFNLRKIFIVSVLALCVVAINFVVFLKITEKADNTEYNKQEVIIDAVAVTENFNKIFDNTIDYQDYSVNVTKKDGFKELIYTSYKNQDELENNYKLNINIPCLNIDTSMAALINEEINSLFYNKATNILLKTEQYTVYDVKYKAYINDNILSLVINATLKEGNNAQREIFKTYNYNLSSNEKLNINEVLSYRTLSKEDVQNKIYETIKIASANANKYNQIGYSKYLRNINDDMYKIENTTVYFMGENKAVYILYPYGNLNYTSEFDLLVV